MALIEIVEYRCSWPEEFAEIGGRLRRSLGRRALIKAALAESHADDVDAYYAVKDPVCDLIMAAAQAWAEKTAWELPESDA